MSSLIRIKRRSRLPWKNNPSSKSPIINQSTMSNDTESESTNINCLKTSDFSNLSKITTVTPPSYSVYENSEGEMINEKENVKWPERPLTGYHSLKEYKKRKAFIRKNIRNQEESSKNNEESTDPIDTLNIKKIDKNEISGNFLGSCVTTGKCADMGFCNMPDINCNEENPGNVDYLNGLDMKQSYIFCGVKTSEEVKLFVKNHGIFYLFYDNKKSDGKIQFEIPLKVAYFDTKTNDYVIKNVFRKFIEHMIQLPQF